MATVGQSPSGFSYAQAAKGRAQQSASQTSSSKVTSGAASPATGASAELGTTSNGNWADDVEAAVEGGATESQKSSSEQVKAGQPKDSPVDRAKQEARTNPGPSTISSPDLGPSSSTTTNNDDSSSAINGTSSDDTTWETKSQSSDPVWVAERKERQNAAQQTDTTAKSGKKSPKEPKEPALAQPPQKAVAYQEAPPPSVNIWAKRMEDAKTKPATPQQAIKPAQAAMTPNAIKTENQRPRADSRKKANSIADLPRDAELPSKNAGATKADDVAGQHATNARSAQRQGLNPTAVTSNRTDSFATGPSKPAQRPHQSLPNTTAPPPSVKDEVSWPTPESAQGVERKDSSAERDPVDNAELDAASEGKARTKTSWKPLAVTPNIVWETPEMNRHRGQPGDRGGRGGSSTRARGGLRGGANGPKPGDRSLGRSSSVHGEPQTPGISAVRPDAADREAMPPPPKPARAPSNSASRERNHPRASNNRLYSSKPARNGSLPGDQSSSFTSKTFPDGRRTKSPSKTDVAAVDDQDEIRTPGPIPRSRVDTTQPEDESEAMDSSARDMSQRASQADGRKDSRPFDGYSKDWNGTSRGGKRNGRGRGGGVPREFTNGHAASQGFGNGHPDPMGGPPHGVPASPTAFSSGRGNQGFMQQQGRGGWSRNNPRANSLPLDTPYAGRFPSFSPQNQLSPLQMQAFFPGMYEYGGNMPMSPMPFPAMSDHDHLLGMVSVQLEYYFSLDNLLKDMFLRKNMDSQGFVFLDVVANFNRLKQLTPDKELIRAACMKSETIDIRVGEDGKERLRVREGWDKFLLPIEQRERTAQTDGPQVLQRPEPQQLQFWNSNAMPYRGMPQNGVAAPHQRRSFDPGYAPFNGMAPQYVPITPLAEPPYGEPMNGEEHRGRAPKSPMREPGFPLDPATSSYSPQKVDLEPDVFPYETAKELMVVVRVQNKSRARHHSVASRTFSNGSIDSRSIFGEMEKSAEDKAHSTTGGEDLTNGDRVNGNGLPSHERQNSTSSPSKAITAPETEVLWTKDTELPQKQLPQDVTLEPYLVLREKALKQRDQAATGTCPYDLDVLYQFWSHFLIRNFNKRMYKDFKLYAHDDARVRHNATGLQNLVQFYNKAFASTSIVRDAVLRDYIELVQNESAILRGSALKQLRSVWRDGSLNLKNRKKLADLLTEPLKSQLES